MAGKVFFSLLVLLSFSVVLGFKPRPCECQTSGLSTVFLDIVLILRIFTVEQFTEPSFYFAGFLFICFLFQQTCISTDNENWTLLRGHTM